jgi:hypothetical protein
MPTLAKKEVPRTKHAERMLEVCPVSKVDEGALEDLGSAVVC